MYIHVTKQKHRQYVGSSGSIGSVVKSGVGTPLTTTGRDCSLIPLLLIIIKHVTITHHTNIHVLHILHISYMYIDIYMYIVTYIHTNIHTYMCILIHTHILHPYIHTYIHNITYTRITSIHTVRTCTYMYIHTYIHAVHTYTYYIHPSIHT